MLAMSIFVGCGRRDLILEMPIEELSKSLNEIIPRLMDKNDVVGLSVVVIRKNKIQVTEHFGYADLEAKKQIGQGTIYKAASLGKPIFSYIVVALEQQGVIDLDKPLYLYYGEAYVKDDYNSKDITARMVLSHTTGLPNLGSQAKPNLLFKPGTGFEYSGHGYEYLQTVIENITGKKLNELAKNIVFDPLYMTASSYAWRNDYENVISHSYGNQKDKYKVESESEAGHAAWSLYTTPEDYSKFVSHIMKSAKNGGSVASQLLNPNIDVAKGVKWGLGWGIQDTEPYKSFWHWGSMAGFKHYVVGYPEEQVAVIVMANSRKSFKMIQHVMEKSIGGDYPSYDWF